MKPTVERLVKLANTMDEKGFVTEAGMIDTIIQKITNRYKAPNKSAPEPQYKETLPIDEEEKEDWLADPQLIADDIVDQDPNYVPGQETVWDELATAS